MRQAIRWALWLGTLGGIAGCGGAAGGGGGPDAPVGGATVEETDGGRLVLRDPGRAPRRALRFDLAEGLVQEAAVVSSQSITVRTPGQPEPMTFDIPEIRQTLRLGPVARTAAGFRFPYALLRIEGPGDDALQAELDRLGGLAGVVEIDDRGRTLDYTIDVPDTAPPHVVSLGKTLEQGLRTAFAQLPGPPVGVGARWTNERDVVANVTMHLVADHELVSLEEDALEMTTRVKQTAAPQQIEIATGGTMDVERLSGSGSGWSRIGLTRLVSDARTEVEVHMEGWSGGPEGEPVRLEMDNRTVTTVHPGAVTVER